MVSREDRRVGGAGCLVEVKGILSHPILVVFPDRGVSIDVELVHGL